MSLTAPQQDRTPPVTLIPDQRRMGLFQRTPDPCGTEENASRKHSETNRDKAFPEKIEIDPGIPGFHVSLPFCTNQSRLKVTGGRKVDFLRGSASAWRVRLCVICLVI